MINKKSLLITFIIIPGIIILSGICLVTVSAFINSELLTDMNINLHLKESENNQRKPPENQNTNFTILGVMVHEFESILINSGFTCGEFEIFKDSYLNKKCVLDEVNQKTEVNILSSDEIFIHLIDTNFTQENNPSNQQARMMLGFIASIPYTGSEPEKARSWVQITLDQMGEKSDGIQQNTFGNVLFRLYGSPSDRSLEIGILD
ncbi:MAG: hypothetical protein JEZ06_20740 [Anaerolineaceae bacterium]|nr:hypothetical protein [Anaerolineaceae bacterium]